MSAGKAQPSAEVGVLWVCLRAGMCKQPTARFGTPARTFGTSLGDLTDRNPRWERRAGGLERAFFHQVAHAQLNWIHAQRGSQFVHHLFGAVHRLWAAESAERA